MISSAVTLSLVPEMRAGPFVFHGDLDAGCARARALGFDAVELFFESGNAVPLSAVQSALAQHGLKLAALGSGAGWVKHQLSLTHPEPDARARARQFVFGLINFGGFAGAPVIVGSMQGRWGEGVTRETALTWLAEELRLLSERSAAHQQVLLFEPLNRYETNLFNRAADVAEFLERHGLTHVRVLCDLFHMNIEEADIAATLRALGPRVGHVHFADSNRRAVGWGHTAMEPVMAALHEIGYAGYLSAEIFPLPDAEAAAAQTMKAFGALAHGGTGRANDE